MAELKTKKTTASVEVFLEKISSEEKRKDAFELLKIFKEVTGENPSMWGESIVGFGLYHYKSEKSKQEGDWPRVGFSPRKDNLTIYLMAGVKGHVDLLEKLGKHKTSSGSCLYIKRLSDIDLGILKKLILSNLKEMEKRYPSQKT